MTLPEPESENIPIELNSRRLLPLSPYFKQLTAIATVLILTVGLGLAVKLSQENQDPFKKAGEASIIRVDLSVNKIDSTKYGLSAQAVGDSANEVSYQWGVSSTNSIGTLNIHSSNKYAEFILNGNEGRADIWVAVDGGITNSYAIAMGPEGPYVPVSPISTPTPSPIPPRHISDTGVNLSILILNFDPVFPEFGGKKLYEQFSSWANPTTITNDLISEFPKVSKNYVNYVIKETINIDGFPIKEDGFAYTTSSYKACLDDHSKCHASDPANYRVIFDKYNVCAKNVDEVWMWGGPWFGYQEFRPVDYCGRTVFVMGFNYERTKDEAFHDFGHRFEHVGETRIGKQKWAQDETNEFNKFSLINGHCGNIHYPPRSIIGTDEYNYSKTVFGQSDCDGYLNYPNGPFTQASINCQSWGCSQWGYVSWWLKHIPSNTGISTHNGTNLFNNWWKYYVYYDETKDLQLPAPNPTPTSISWKSRTSWFKADNFYFTLASKMFSGQPDIGTTVKIDDLSTNKLSVSWTESGISLNLSIFYNEIPEFDSEKINYAVSKLTISNPTTTDTYHPVWTTRDGYPFETTKEEALQSDSTGVLYLKNIYWFPGLYNFEDLDSSKWSWKHVQKILPTRIMTPVFDGLFAPTQEITRTDMALFLARAYEYITQTKAVAVDTPFTDIGLLSPEVQDAIKKIYGLKITAGTGTSTYSPDTKVNRAQMATFLSNLYKAVTGNFAPEVTVPFKDIYGEDITWAQKPIARIYGLKVTAGISPTEFGPYLITTREQMATFIMNFIEALSRTTISIPTPTPTPQPSPTATVGIAKPTVTPILINELVSSVSAITQQLLTPAPSISPTSLPVPEIVIPETAAPQTTNIFIQIINLVQNFFRQILGLP